MAVRDGLPLVKSVVFKTRGLAEMFWSYSYTFMNRFYSPEICFISFFNFYP